jgi:Metallo-peptidase family M12B Reprolysin-like
MERRARRQVVVALAAVFVLAGIAQSPLLAAPAAGAGSGRNGALGAQPPARSADGVWAPSSQPAARAARTDRRIFNGPHALVHLDKTSLDTILQRAPMERRAGRQVSATVMSLPMPDGSFQAFRIQESPILVPELAALVPGIRTYSGQGLDDPAATARFDWTPTGFHGMVHAPNGTTFVDPVAAGDIETYVSYAKRDYSRDDTSFLCLVGGAARAASGALPAMDIVNGATLRTYRLALAATVEYMAAAGGTKLLALSRMTTTMNRVNGIYERELAVRMTVMTGPVGCSASPSPTDACMALIAPDPILYPYTNGDAATMLGQNQANIDAIIGPANYDIGHVFATAGGGLAEIAGTCNGLYKAEGVTGAANPTGDAFDVDYVAHEMGHQFGGHHTFNGTSGSCGPSDNVPNRSADHAYEPGSGSTIMAYAGICSPENLQSHSQDNFHVESLNEITAFITNASTGGSCAVPSATGNTPPTVTAGSGYTIPALTPFALTATASDPNPDALTYS